ncbi:MAG: DUF1565 domain-containing protein [Synechococcus sp.]
MRLARLASSALILLFTSCGTGNEPIATTHCDAAIARANYRWRVDYERNKTSSNNRITDRFEFFAGNQLININGEEPLNAVSGPDGDGIWWPALPARPTPEMIEARRDRLETNDDPLLVRTVDYFLQCEAGDLTANQRTYRRASNAFRKGENLEASHSLGRVLQVRMGITESNATNSDSADMSNASDRVAPSPSPTILHVNPESGSDSNLGTLDQPYRTISRAMAAARPGDTVRLSEGTYDEVSGEQFPILVGKDISLVGDELRRGSNITIAGGGKYLTHFWAEQNVTLVAGDRARISGVTLSNVHDRGTAIWVESGTATISNNTFTANAREGIFASGTASPTIRANLFVDNGGNGVSFTRDSSGIFEGNTVSDSGYGVSVSESATPFVVRNTIVDNRSGILVTGTARPILKENTISRNQQGGIVAIGESAPSLRGNTLAQNGQFDINNATGTPLAVE